MAPVTVAAGRLAAITVAALALGTLALVRGPRAAAAAPGPPTAAGNEARVVWETPRTAGQSIPAGARELDVEVYSLIRANAPRHRTHLLVTRPTRVRAVVALLDELPAEQPEFREGNIPLPRACPNDTGIRVRLVFRAAAHAAPLAIATLRVAGCGGVGLTVEGRSEPGLESTFPLSGPRHGRSLLAELDRVLGRTLDVTPRSIE